MTNLIRGYSNRLRPGLDLDDGDTTGDGSGGGKRVWFGDVGVVGNLPEGGRNRETEQLLSLPCIVFTDSSAVSKVSGLGASFTCFT